MTTDYFSQYEPFFNAWYIKEQIGEGSFGKVFRIEREDFGVRYKAALKTITIPGSQSEIKSVMSDGMDREKAISYFQQVVKDIVSEFVLMSKLKGTSNIVSYEDHQVIEHKERICWDILIRMELLTPLIDYVQEKQFSTEDVIRLGIDMCRALELCRKYDIVHRDIKPENIFVSENGDFKLGDFGIARTMEKTGGGLSKKGTTAYMAPEIYREEEYGPEVDIYSLGIVLYRLLNENRTPFLPNYPTPIAYYDRDIALKKRIRGEILPKPTKAHDRLAAVVLKACEYKPENRFQTPTQMRLALEEVLNFREEFLPDQMPGSDKRVQTSGRPSTSGMNGGAESAGADGLQAGQGHQDGRDNSDGRGHQDDRDNGDNQSNWDQQYDRARFDNRDNQGGVVPGERKKNSAVPYADHSHNRTLSQFAGQAEAYFSGAGGGYEADKTESLFSSAKGRQVDSGTVPAKTRKKRMLIPTIAVFAFLVIAGSIGMVLAMRAASTPNISEMVQPETVTPGLSGSGITEPGTAEPQVSEANTETLQIMATETTMPEDGAPRITMKVPTHPDTSKPLGTAEMDTRTTVTTDTLEDTRTTATTATATTTTNTATAHTVTTQTPRTTERRTQRTTTRAPATTAPATTTEPVTTAVPVAITEPAATTITGNDVGNQVSGDVGQTHTETASQPELSTREEITLPRRDRNYKPPDIDDILKE